MSERAGMPANSLRGGFRFRNPREFFGGFVLVVVGLFALWAGSDLSGLQGFAFGPGTAPRLFASILVVLGIAIMLTGFFTDGPHLSEFSFSGPLAGGILVVVYILVSLSIGKVFPAVSTYQVESLFGSIAAAIIGIAMRRHAPRGPIFITMAILVFAGCIRTAGLVITSYFTVLAAAAATPEVRWLETSIWAAVLTVFCSILFPTLLNLPLQLWPSNLLQLLGLQ